MKKQTTTNAKKAASRKNFAAGALKQGFGITFVHSMMDNAKLEDERPAPSEQQFGATLPFLNGLPIANADAMLA